jgi:hypothetical protein
MRLEKKTEAGGRTLEFPEVVSSHERGTQYAVARLTLASGEVREQTVNVSRAALVSQSTVERRMREQNDPTPHTVIG